MLQYNREQKVIIFYELLKIKNFRNAVETALADEKTFRSQIVVEEIKNLFIPSEQNQCMQYFIELSKHTTLNEYESLEFCKIASYRQQAIENLLKNKRLKVTEKVANVLKSIDPRLAVEAYNNLELYKEVFECLVLAEQYEKIPEYKTKFQQFQPDYLGILNTLLENNKQRGIDFVQILLNGNIGFNDFDSLIEIFLKHNLVEECTSFLMELLKNNCKNEGKLQTRLIEINILKNPEIADLILSSHMFLHFDHFYIASLCEKYGLLQHALELYTDMENKTRILVKSHTINSEWLINYFGLLKAEDALNFLKAMLQNNLSANLDICVKIATQNYDKLNIRLLIEVFESVNSFEGIFAFLKTFIDSTQSEELIFKYVEAAYRIGQFKEVERICKENNWLNAEKIKTFLTQFDLHEPTALISICNRFNFDHDLTLYFYKYGAINSIESYAINNPKRLPVIIGALAFVNCSPVFILRMMNTFANKYNLEELVRAVDKQDRLDILQDILEEMVKKGSKQAFVHTALAKIYIKSNSKPEIFLKENLYYISRVIGNYCEKDYPRLALIAYSRGQVDDDLIRLCENNNMIEELVDYLIKRDKKNIWLEMFNKAENPQWRKLFDCFLSLSIHGSYGRQELKTVIKVLFSCDIKKEFEELLEHTIPKESVLYEVTKEYTG